MDFKYLEEALKRQCVDRSDLVPVAFSGGPDSFFLICGLIKLGYRPVILYVNYHDSPTVDKEEKTVIDLVDKYKLPFYKKDAAIASNENFENAARTIRYSFFKTIINKLNVGYILTAHHKNDDAETFLLQKKRHNIVEYYGLKERNTIFDIDVIRPLLEYSKKEIVAFLKANNISYYDDPTNYENTKQRNILRNNYSDEKLFATLKEKESLNLSLATTYAKINQLLKNDKIDRTTYLSLEDTERKRLLFKFLQSNISQFTDKECKSYANKIFMRLNSPKSFAESLTGDLAVYGTSTKFFICERISQKPYSYRFDERRLYDFPEFSIDLTDSTKFHIEHFPIFVENATVGDRITTDIQQNKVWAFLKKHHVPSFLLNIYPVFKDDDKNIFYVPFYEDLEQNKLPIKLKLFTSKGRKVDKGVL